MGFVANPASRRDIRRLVAGATVFRNADKPGMMFRLLSPAPGTRRTGSRPGRFNELLTRLLQEAAVRSG